MSCPQQHGGCWLRFPRLAAGVIDAVIAVAAVAVVAVVAVVVGAIVAAAVVVVADAVRALQTNSSRMAVSLSVASHT